MLRRHAVLPPTLIEQSEIQLIIWRNRWQCPYTNRKFVPAGTIPSNQTPFFFLSDKCELTAGSDDKNNAAPLGIEPGSSDCRSDALTTELRSHDRNCVRICLSPSLSVLFTTKWPARSSLQTRRDQRKLAGFNYNCSNWKFALAGTIPSNQTPFCLLSDKCELTAGSDEKNTAQPRRGSNLGLPIAGRTLKPLSYEAMTGTVSVVRTSERLSEDPGSIPGGAALCFFFRLIQLSVHICRIEKRKEFD